MCFSWPSSKLTNQQTNDHYGKAESVRIVEHLKVLEPESVRIFRIIYTSEFPYYLGPLGRRLTGTPRVRNVRTFPRILFIRFLVMDRQKFILFLKTTFTRIHYPFPSCSEMQLLPCKPIESLVTDAYEME